MADSDDKISLLYVDDEAVLLDIMKEFIRRYDEFVIDTAGCAAEGLLKINNNKYDAIISDYQMPGMDGIEFLTEIRNSGNEIPFILYTGKGREEVAIKALNSGADYYLQKGVNPKVSITELRNFILHAVAKKKAEKTVREEERKMADVMNFLPDATFAIDKSGKVIVWNRAMEKITGIPAEEMLGHDNFEYSLPFYGKRRPFLIDIVLNKILVQDSDYFILYPEDEKLIAETFAPELYGGKGAYIRCTASVLYNSDGEITGAIESVRDISDEKSAEKERFEFIKKLQEQKNLIDAVFDVTPVNFYVYEKDMKFRYVCTKGAEQLGMKPEDMTGKTWRELNMPAEQFEPHEKEIMEVFSTGKVISSQTIYPTILGNRHYQYELSPIMGINGEFDAVVSTAINITDIKEAETLYKTIFENTGTAMLIIDENFSILDYNEELKNISGYGDEFLKGCRDVSRLTVKEDIFKIIEYQNKRKSDPENVPYNYELRFIHKDGTVKEAIINVGAIPGTMKSVISIRDITDEKHYGKELKSTKDTLNFAIDGAELGLWDRNLITNEVFHNDNWAEMFGYRSNEIEDDFKFWKEQIHPKDLPLVYQAHKDHLSGKSDTFNVVCRMKYRDGSWKWINSRGKVVAWDSDGKATRMVGLNSDITHLKETEEALKQANEKLGLLSSITRHDTFNKITGIVLSIELLKTKLAGTDMIENLEYIEKLVDTISEELEFARDYEELGNFGFVWQDFTACLPYEKIPDRLTVKADLSGIEILADPMLGKVVHNLIDNAIRHGKKVTKIEITHEFTPEGLMIIWEDNGVGVAPHMKEKIFERGIGSNTGLGLFLASEILSISGIKIKETGTEGKGARFEISVPKECYR